MPPRPGITSHREPASRTGKLPAVSTSHHCSIAHLPYLLLKVDACQIPLRDSSASLVLATPPVFGQKRFYKGEFCTNDPGEYAGMMQRFLAEAARIVKPGGYVLLGAKDDATPGLKVFRVLQKRRYKRRWRIVCLASQIFRQRYVRVKNFYWLALPLSVYRSLVAQFSKRGDVIVHAFAGSGNGGLAALELDRKPVLVDLHYQQLARRRLDRFLQRKAHFLSDKTRWQDPGRSDR